MNRLLIIGASGHGKVIADIAVLNGYSDIAFLDDNVTVKECAGYPVIGNTSDLPEGDVIVAIGSANIRKRIMELHNSRVFPVLIHPAATVAQKVEIGKGSVVMAGAVINPGTKIGVGCIVNTSSSIDHDCVIGDYSHVSVGSHLCGTVNLGNQCWIGAGSTISNNITICSDVMIGAGAVVVKDIEESGTYIGVPARKMSRNIDAALLDSMDTLNQ